MGALPPFQSAPHLARTPTRWSLLHRPMERPASRSTSSAAIQNHPHPQPHLLTMERFPNSNRVVDSQLSLLLLEPPPSSIWPSIPPVNMSCFPVKAHPGDLSRSSRTSPPPKLSFSFHRPIRLLCSRRTDGLCRFILIRKCPVGKL